MKQILEKKPLNTTVGTKKLHLRTLLKETNKMLHIRKNIKSKYRKFYVINEKSKTKPHKKDLIYLEMRLKKVDNMINELENQLRDHLIDNEVKLEYCLKKQNAIQKALDLIEKGE